MVVDYIGSLNYVEILLMASGALVLLSNAIQKLQPENKGQAGKKRDQKIMIFFSWFNIALGAVLFIAGWIYREWILFMRI
jgi:hypothetical protein